jgi:RNA polymerase sigma-70 factor, ECF subfamily
VDCQPVGATCCHASEHRAGASISLPESCVNALTSKRTRHRSASPAESRTHDAAFVTRARAGDAAAFTALVRRHLPAAFAVARSVVVERADAEDVCQDAFVTAFTRLAQCQPAEQFRAWLLRITHNRAITLLRWQRVRTAAVLGTGPGESDVPASGESPLAAAERADIRARLMTALARLPTAQHTVVILHDIDGWGHRDIAALLGIADGTSRSTLFDARRRLRAQLAPLLEPAPLTRQLSSR